MGTYRAVKVVYRTDFEHDRPFEREFEGIQKFEPISRTHESQVDILHVGRNDPAGYFYYVMELADDQELGQTIDPDKYLPKSLRSELHRQGRLPLEACLQIGLNLTTALEHLHKHGLVHRDVKPSNIIFVNGIPKLADIGLVASMEATMSFVGTAGYLAPEGAGTPQADIYSLGKVLYELCTGRDRQDFPELPTQWREFVDQEGLLEFNAVLLRACASDGRQRYQTAHAMHADLALLQAGKSVRRLRSVERRLAIITRIGLATGLATLVAIAAYFGAVKQARRAQRAERQMAQQFYAADMNRVMQFYEKGKLNRAIDLLEAHRPAGAAHPSDLRGFEWFYLWRLCHKDNARDTWRTDINGLTMTGFSPDLALLAASGPKGPLTLWDRASRHPLGVLTNFGGENQDWAFRPDGKLLAYGTATGSIELWDIGARRVVGTLPSTNQSVYSLVFSPDAALLAWVERDSTAIQLLEIASEHQLGTLRNDKGGFVCGLAFDSDGRLLASGYRDNLVTLWDVASRGRLAEIQVPMGFASKLVFSPDRRTLAVAGLSSIVALCDVGSGNVIGVLPGHEGTVNDVAFSPDGGILATASDDTTIKLWQVSSLQLLTTIKGSLDRVTTVAFSPGSQTLVSVSGDGTVQEWDLAQRPDADVLIGHENWVRCVAFSRDGKTIASASKDKTIKLWDVPTGRLLATQPGHQRPVFRLALSADGRTLASGSGLVTEGNSPGEVKLWDIVAQKELAPLTNQNTAVTAVAFNRDGRMLATASADGSVALWDVMARRQLANWLAHSNQVHGLAFSPEDKLLATGGHDNTVKLWDWSARRELAVFPGSPRNGTDYGIWCLAFSPDGGTLAAGNDDGTVSFWDMGSREPSPSLSGTAGKVYSLAFSRDGKTLATGTIDNSVTLWHLATGQELFVLRGHSGPVESVAFSADGATLASASADKTIRLWRASP
jgi:WD40 repeat protein